MCVLWLLHAIVTQQPEGGGFIMPFSEIIRAVKALSLFSVALLVLGACSGMQLEKAAQTSTKGPVFNDMLHRGYMNLAREEYSENDYGDSDYFADKAIALAGGTMVQPDEVASRKIPADSVGTLTSARDRLMKALAGTATKKAAASAAHAQVMYDCWIQELEENLQPEHIAKCRAGFTTAIELAELALKKKKKAPKKMAMAPKPMKKAAPAIPMEKIFVIFFDLNSTHLNTKAHLEVGRIADAVAKHGTLRIFLAGHTDRSGGDKYNAALSQERADAVAFALMDAGVEANLIRMEAKGESAPLVRTDDGVKEENNRRVTAVVRKK